MEHKPLFAELIAAHKGLAEELKTVDVAADLALLLTHAGKSRAELARELGWSRARVTQVLSGQENLTVQTIAAVAAALGFTFDVAFRKTADRATAQPWSQSKEFLTLEIENDIGLQDWMSRATMSPMNKAFKGAMEFANVDLRLTASNQDFLTEEVGCAA